MLCAREMVHWVQLQQLKMWRRAGFGELYELIFVWGINHSSLCARELVHGVQLQELKMWRFAGFDELHKLISGGASVQ